MAGATYLHGVETIEDLTGPIPITTVRTAVVALTGIAPKGPVQQLIAVNSSQDAAQFGDQVPGFNIPKALAAIQKQGYGTVLVVNIWDEATMSTAVAAESVVVANRAGKMAFANVGAAAPVVTNSAGTTTYVAGTDYTIDAYGNIKVLVAAIADGVTLKVTYKKLDATGVTSSKIIGTVTGSVRTGYKLFETSFNRFGYNPKIIITPGYSHLAAIQSEMLVIASKYKAIALIDGTPGQSVSAAIGDRGPAGVPFNTADRRAYLLYPQLKAAVADPAILDTDPAKYENQPYSQFMAGVICATDYNEGYWFSPSNHEIKGITGLSVDVTAAINDPSTETNQLNAVGITTVFGSFGTGLRTWGNRSAAYPTNSHVSNFVPVLRTSDVINESVELSMLPFVDKPITQAVIDSVRESVNAFLRTLIARGALIDGKNPITGRTTGCYYNPAQSNPAAGHYVFDNEFCVATPGEWFTFNSHIDVTYLQSLR